MTILNTDIAAKFDELADLLAITDANPFRVRAYRNAAHLIANMSQELAELVKAGTELANLPGIGKDLAEKITTLVVKNELPILSELKKSLPPVVTEMLLIPTLGPQRIKVLHQHLPLKTLADLQKAAETDVISKIPGFGKKTQAKILEAILRLTNTEPRIKLSTAEQLAKPLLAYLQGIAGVTNVVVAGSFRRCRETVGDLDILVATKEPARVIEAFIHYSGVQEVIAHGTTRAAILLTSNVQVDLLVVAAKYWGAALLYFTGSKEHNVALRTLALKQQLHINEYGVFHEAKWLAGRSEAEVYQQLGMEYIEPELRENRGEILAALTGKLPKLVAASDIKGDLHCHTNASGDATGTLEDLIAVAKSYGWQYLAVTDHSQHLTIANGLDAKRLAEQIKLIDKVNAKYHDFRVLKSIECDILADGSLDLPNSILKELDLVVCSIHSKFRLTQKEQTERILRAMDNPYFNILAHPTGRLLLGREPYAIDLERIMQEARKVKVFLELNANPDRLDLNAIHCNMAQAHGIKISIGTDAHRPENLAHMRYGIMQARRGWLTASNVLNTLDVTTLLQTIRRL